jgi:hypothetical protein
LESGEVGVHGVHSLYLLLLVIVVIVVIHEEMVVGRVVVDGLLDGLGIVSLGVLSSHDAGADVEVLVDVDVLVQVALVLSTE